MSNYLKFQGIAGRSEYWGVTVIITLVFLAVLTLGTALATTGEISGIIAGSVIIFASVIFYIWYFLAVTIKRCRDIGINPWWTASCFLPYVGFIPWIILGCLPAENKDN